MVTTARSKVKLRPHHNVAHLQPPTNVPTKYELPTPYGFQDIAWTRFYRSRSLQQGQSSNQGHIMMMDHTYTPNQCPCQVSTSYTLQFLRYSMDNVFSAASLPAHPDTIGENNTQRALKGCGEKAEYQFTFDIYYHIEIFTVYGVNLFLKFNLKLGFEDIPCVGFYSITLNLGLSM